MAGSALASRRTLALLDGLGVALGLWGMLAPVPYGLCIAALLVAPVAAIGIAWASHGAVSLNDRRRQKRPHIGALFLFPALILGARGLLDFNVLDWTAPLILATPLAVLMTFAAVRAELEFRRWFWVLFLLPLTLAWSWGAISEANGIFDRTPVQVVSTEVLQKRMSGVRSVSYHLEIAPTTIAGMGTEVEVRRAVYRQVAVGGRICLELHGGSLGWRWFRPKACDASASP